ncbi:MAG: hypothetical protein ABH878_05170, partial [bacterium]
MKRIIALLVIGGTLLFVGTALCGEHPLYTQAKSETDVQKAIDLYWRFFKEADKDPSFSDAAGDFARLLAKHDRFADIVSFGDYLMHLAPAPAGAMNTMAYALAEADTALDKALNYSYAAAGAQRLARQLPPPPEKSPKAWQERQDYIFGLYLDTQGYIFLKQGESQKALNVFLQADSMADDAEIKLHLGQAYLATGK